MPYKSRIPGVEKLVCYWRYTRAFVLSNPYQRYPNSRITEQHTEPEAECFSEIRVKNSLAQGPPNLHPISSLDKTIDGEAINCNLTFSSNILRESTPIRPIYIKMAGVHGSLKFRPGDKKYITVAGASKRDYQSNLN